ncbi:chromosomal replication initiator protein DnaA [Conexibacter sp. DBS9H8]|uniref:chromosomal replication initiator protein DnaA n=1 Tax=Conexibacter sp. DBS9H8 TaxID=2937801 RepID=UPI00200CBE7F|nr:chromosomal replication initiator protein DnaA [Conexibacter sp. DBS9H8]
MHLEMTHAWQRARAELRRLVGDSTFEIWLAGLECADWDGTTVTLSAPVATQAWVASRFARALQRSVHSAFGPHARLAFTTTSTPGHSTVQRPPRPDGVTDPRADLERFIPRYTFDQFIIGDANRLAHAAALAVAEHPGHAYNPLFLYAPPGLGKTHLLHAIANYISTYDPHTRVRYTTVESFTNRFLAALQQRSTAAFKALHRDADVLLIDDVQFLAAKAKTEEEFFHTFNALYDNGHQVVITADRLPRQMAGLEDRLRARFEAGLVTEIAPPTRATRIAILRKRAALDEITVPDETVLELIADRIQDNVRALEGALIRVVAHHSLTGRPLDAALAADVLEPLHPGPSHPAGASLSLERIQTLVAGHFGVSVADLCSSRRTAVLTWPRQLAVFLSRELTGASLQAIGDAYGGRNHATVLHACQRVSERTQASSEDAAELTSLRSLLTAAGADRSC